MNKYPFKTNEWQEEDIEIPSFEPVVNEKENRVEFKQTKRTVTRKTYYAESKPKKFICNSHVYSCIDKHRYIFKCNKCNWHITAPPHKYKFDPSTGQIIPR